MWYRWRQSKTIVRKDFERNLIQSCISSRSNTWTDPFGPLFYYKVKSCQHHLISVPDFLVRFPKYRQKVIYKRNIDKPNIVNKYFYLAFIPGLTSVIFSVQDKTLMSTFLSITFCFCKKLFTRSPMYVPNCVVCSPEICKINTRWI